MNKELNYILQGVLLIMLIIGAFSLVRFLLASRIRSTQASENASLPSAAGIVINSKGEALFQENCSVCHSVWKVEGYSIFKVEQRVPDKRLLYEWIRNSSGVLRSGNKYFNELVQKFGNVRMPDFPHLTDDDITAILEYIRQVDTLKNAPPSITKY